MSELTKKQVEAIYAEDFENAIFNDGVEFMLSEIDEGIEVEKNMEELKYISDYRYSELNETNQLTVRELFSDEYKDLIYDEELRQELLNNEEFINTDFVSYDTQENIIKLIIKEGKQ